EARVAPLEGGEGAVLLLRDVTEAARYERLRREFVANVSHELRTPLSLVKGFLETLEDGALKDVEKGPRFVNIASRHVAALEELVVTVRDTGQGIPPEDLGRIFERFYRVEKSRSREAGGTGLGLAIVKHIAAQERGSISVQSELGKGSCFRLLLPTTRG